jgi:hypothetical protein
VVDVGNGRGDECWCRGNAESVLGEVGRVAGLAGWAGRCEAEDLCGGDFEREPEPMRGCKAGAGQGVADVNGGKARKQLKKKRGCSDGKSLNNSKLPLPPLQRTGKVPL